MANKKNSAKAAGSLSQDILKKGDKISLEVTKDSAGKAVFAASLNDCDQYAEKMPTMRVVPLKCAATLQLAKGQLWEVGVTNVVLTEKCIPLRGQNRKIVHVFVNDFKRIERVLIRFRHGHIFREVFSGKCILESDSIPAEMKSRRMRYHDNLYDIGEIFVSGRLVMRIQEKCLGKPGNGIFDKLAPELSQTQFASFGKLYVSWENLLDLYTQPPQEEQEELSMAA
jgi:hypothetical protein